MSLIKKIKIRIRASVASILLLGTGCQPSPIELHGTVTLDGKPLDEAAVIFVPLEKTSRPRKKTGCPIVKGEYCLPLADGVTSGKYRIEIVDVPPLSVEHAPESRRRRLFPHRYSHNSPLVIEIPPDAQAEKLSFNFEIQN